MLYVKRSQILCATFCVADFSSRNIHHNGMREIKENETYQKRRQKPKLTDLLVLLSHNMVLCMHIEKLAYSIASYNIGLIKLLVHNPY